MTPGERDASMAAGKTAFNRGEFYEAHEHWEQVWDELDDPQRSWVQGMIQVATGLHKLTQMKAEVALRLIQRGLGKLSGVPATLWGIDTGTLVADAEALAGALARGQAQLPGFRNV